MKLVLYGLGQGLNLVEEKIRKVHEIVGYMDSFSDLKVFREKPFYRLENINQILFDYIIITIQEKKTSWEVYNMLVNDYKIPCNYIIPFYVYANYELCDIKIKNCNLDKLQGLIFGNSYAECGFMEEELSVPFLNLAVSAQDIYYNYQTFKKCITNYGNKIKNLHYVIIDLYDYYYFNLDTSMTICAVDYICWGGYLDAHNFKKNHNYQKTFSEELFDMSYIWERPQIMYELFENFDVRRNDLHVTSRWRHIEKKNGLTSGPIIGSPVLKRSEETIKENVKLLDLFLKDIRNFSADIKIIFTLIPRYVEMERATEIVMKSWKEEFNLIINDFCDRYDALFWNYKNRKELSENHMFYYDVEHMNTVGGRALSAILNEDLKKL